MAIDDSNERQAVADSAELTAEAPTGAEREPDGLGGWIHRWFEIGPRGSTVRTEVIGGATTFLTLVYIVFVNPAILSGTADLGGTHLQFDQVLAVTALCGGLLTIAMGVFGRYPFALAAGLGLNAYAAAEVAAHRFMSASSNTTFIESNAGVAAGARTGLASVITGALLLLCMFISPIAGMIPPQATAQALVIVGVMMFGLVRDLRWDNATPLAVFATIIVMPVTYSIANGIGVGLILHTVSELLRGRRVSIILIIFSGFFVWYFLHGAI